MKIAGRQIYSISSPYPFSLERRDSESQDCRGSRASDLHPGRSSMQSDQEIQVDGTGSRVGRRGKEKATVRQNLGA